MLLYADVADLAGWVDEVPDDVETYIRLASGKVRTATRSARYDVGPNGLPSDPDVIEAMRDATCAQAALWISAKINPAEAGISDDGGTVAAKSMGGRSVTYSATSQSVAQARSLAATELCQEARDILTAAGLTGQPSTW